MTVPFYVSPEQIMKDRADYARQGVAKGRSAVVLSYRDGLAFVADNRSSSLHKVSEIYDRIGFVAVGRYNVFENLRIAGIRWADLRGYLYDRSDVSARSLANAYAQTIGAVFASGEAMPFEVELAVGELGAACGDDTIYRITYDGSVTDSSSFLALGGRADAVEQELASRWVESLSLEQVLVLAADALAETGRLPASSLEVGVLDRARAMERKFIRLDPAQILRSIEG